MSMVQKDYPQKPWKLFRSLLSVALLAATITTLAPGARADDEAQINARIGSWGRNCKNAVAAKYPKASMAEISVQLDATHRW